MKLTCFNCLHSCFLPRIEKCIKLFQEAWNHHRLSTEGNATPTQLFLAGLISSNEIPNIPTASSVSCVLPTQGEHVIVPRSKFQPCSLLHHEIQSQFDPLHCTSYFDDGIYVSLLSCVGQHLLDGCSSCSETC